jgi:hypothetical protein
VRDLTLAQQAWPDRSEGRAEVGEGVLAVAVDDEPRHSSVVDVEDVCPLASGSRFRLP